MLIDGLSPSSAETYLRFYNNVAYILGRSPCDPWITPDELGIIYARLGASSARTQNLYRSILSRLIKVGWLSGELDASDCWALNEANKRFYMPARKTRPRGVSDVEADAIAGAVISSGDPRDVRAAAQIGLMARGVYRSAVTRLTVADYQPGRPHGGDCALKTHNGHRGSHAVRVSEVRPLMSAWLDIRGVNPGALFQPFGRSKRPQARPMTVQAVSHSIRKLTDAAGVRPLLASDLRLTEPNVIARFSKAATS